MTAFPPPRRSMAFHARAFALVALVVALLYLAYRGFVARSPARGYTSLGLALGFGAAAAFVVATLYAYRKRAGQEHLPGTLHTWLRVHAWVSLAGFVAVLLHAGFHLDGGSGTYTFVLLALTLLSGVGGWVIYRQVPGAVSSSVGNLATRGTETEIRDLETEMADAAAGRSEGFKARVAALLGAGRSTGDLAPGEALAFAAVERLATSRDAARVRLARQGRLRRWLRTWLWIHVPAAIVFLGALLWHGYEATESNWFATRPSPADFASSESCAKCHPAQYDEWIGSPHAVAMSSPIMDIQNRLVVLKDRRDHPKGDLVVGDLCVKCHAPTAYLPQLSSHEDELASIESRAPASQFGISCVACHQISSMTPNGPSSHVFDRRFINLENLAWSHGRTMFGQFGRPGDAALPSIGNAAHRGEWAPHYDSDAFCASCHTVGVVKPPQGARRDAKVLVLQNTFEEWEEARTSLSLAGAVPSCMHCHNRELSSVAALAQRPFVAGESFTARARAVQAAILGSSVPSADRAAASPRDGFDLPLPERRRFLHTFTGVDVHTSPDTPYVAGHPRHGENESLRAAGLVRTTDLLRTAAAVRIDGWPTDGKLSVTVANIGAGHHLPAGFAFAREMWLEVSTAPRGSNAWRVVVGGRDGRELGNGDPLDKRDVRLRNFQAVLFNADASASDPFRGETVLQNEATDVLTGKAANDRGFVDREKYLLPGEARAVRPIDLGVGSDPWSAADVGRIRVRLRFRSLPPEFIRRLSDLLRAEGDAPGADRALRLIPRLEIIDMAEAIVDAP